MYVGLIRWLRLLPSLGLYMGCTAGNVIYVPLVLCLSSFGLGHQEDNERTRRRESLGEGRKEDRRRRGGGQEKTGRRPGRGPHHTKSQSLKGGVVREVIPRLYIGLYATPGPLLAAPPVLALAREPSRGARDGAVQSHRRPAPLEPSRGAPQSRQTGGPLTNTSFCFKFSSRAVLQNHRFVRGVVVLHNPECNP